MASGRDRQAERSYSRPEREYKAKRYGTQIDGNTVRKLEEAPELYPPVRTDGETVRKVRRNREKALQMSPSFVLFLSVLLVVVLGCSIGYIQVRASIDARIDEVQGLENDLAALKDANEAARSRIGVASDIKEIYRRATEELGMVYPDENQVIYYDRTESEYVQQNESIPK